MTWLIHRFHEQYSCMTSRQTGHQTNRCRVMHADRKADTETDKEIDRETEIQTDRQTDRYYEYIHSTHRHLWRGVDKNSTQPFSPPHFCHALLRLLPCLLLLWLPLKLSLMQGHLFKWRNFFNAREDADATSMCVFAWEAIRWICLISSTHLSLVRKTSHSLTCITDLCLLCRVSKYSRTRRRWRQCFEIKAISRVILISIVIGCFRFCTNSLWLYRE